MSVETLPAEAIALLLVLDELDTGSGIVFELDCIEAALLPELVSAWCIDANGMTPQAMHVVVTGTGRQVAHRSRAFVVDR